MTDNLLWYNAAHRPLQAAIDEACARFAQRVGLPPTNVILPLGEWPEVIGKLKVETDRRVRPWHLEIYSAYQVGDVVCSNCKAVMGHNPEIIVGVSHSICEGCKPIEAAKVEAWRQEQVKQLELI